MRDVVLCNVGGTNISAAAYDGKSLANHVRWSTSEFASGKDLVKRLVQHFGTGRLALAVAGPVLADGVQMTNGSLVFVVPEILKMDGVDECLVVNDIVAAATSEIPEEVLPGQGVLSHFDTLVLNVGTGFGGALMSSTGSGVVGIEPGRLSASSFRAMIERAGLDSRVFFEYEKLISGSGVCLAYARLAEQGNHKHRPNDAAEVFAMAAEGVELAANALELFWHGLGVACAELVLLFPECTRIVLNGSVVLKNWDAFSHSEFQNVLRDRLHSSGCDRPIEVTMKSHKEAELTGLSRLVVESKASLTP